MKTRVVLTVLAVVLMGASSATASWVSIDPDAAANGTIINNYFTGVTLTALGDVGVLPDSNVYAAASGWASTGANVFSNSGAFPATWGNGFFDWLRVDFASSVYLVSLDYIPTDSSDSNPYLEAYDAGGVLLDSATVGLVPFGTVQTLIVSAPGTIAYVEASWDNLSRRDNGALDNLRYESVPVPGAFVLGMLGVGLVSGARRLRRKGL